MQADNYCKQHLTFSIFKQFYCLNIEKDIISMTGEQIKTFFYKQESHDSRGVNLQKRVTMQLVI